MTYWLLAAVAALSTFALFAAAGSLAARTAARFFDPSTDTGIPASRARLLFRLRMLPGIAAAVAAFGVALPIFLWFESRTTEEPIRATLLAGAGAGAFLIARGLWRAASACRSTGRIVRDWQRRGRPLAGLGVPMPVVAIDEAFPTVAVAGILRPRLFVAERVLRECTPEEVAAMVAHECAHVSARDNVKRLLIRACPDVFGTPVHLERAWCAAAEQAADAAAATRHPAARLDLAQALIRVARLAAPRTPALASAFYVGGSIDARVRRLIQPAPAVTPSRWPRFVVGAIAIASAAAILAAAPVLYAAMELAVRLLP